MQSHNWSKWWKYVIIEFSGLNERLYHPLHDTGQAHTPLSTEEGIKRMQKLEDREECCEVVSYR